MNWIKKTSLLAISILAVGAMAFAPSGKLSIGDSAPMADLKMKDVSGKEISLNDLKGNNGLLVIFSCNTCPFVLAWEDQYNMLNKLAKGLEMNMVLVNANEAKRTGDDSMEEMKKHAKKMGYTMPYVVDKNNKLADAFGANTTPHVFLFNKDLNLVYTGLINDMYDQKDRVTKAHYLSDAIQALGRGAKIDPEQTPNRGCSIKRL